VNQPTRLRTTQIVSLKGLAFHVLVGVYPHEREIPQPLEIDIDVWVKSTTRGGGEPPALDYTALYDGIAGIIRRGHVDYLEDLVETIARDAMARPHVDRVRVTARKPHVPLPGPLTGAEVTLELSPDA
jgi:dihydroneopterin aldolase